MTKSEAWESLNRGLKQAKTSKFAKTTPTFAAGIKAGKKLANGDYAVTTGVKIVSNWSGASHDEIRFDKTSQYYDLARSIDKALDRQKKKLIDNARKNIIG